MKKYLGLGVLLVSLFFLGVLACGGTNSITEVGNPSSGPSGSIAAVTDSAEGVTSSIVASHDLNAAFSSESVNKFTCTHDNTSNTSICQCANGGTLIYTFEKGFGGNGNNLIFDNLYQATLTQCAFTTCDTSLTLNGQYSGSMTGTISLTDDSGDLLINAQTSADCSGLTSGEQTIGFKIQITETNLSVQSISGNICVNDQNYSFTSATDLQNQIDPNKTCSNIFH